MAQRQLGSSACDGNRLKKKGGSVEAEHTGLDQALKRSRFRQEQADENWGPSKRGPLRLDTSDSEE